jgi:hypothetical protein
MRKKLLAVSIIIFALPLAAASTRNGTIGSPYSTIAYAGRTLGGGYCDCPSPGCICEPGEAPAVRGTAGLRVAATVNPAKSLDSGLISLASVVGLVLLIWSRMRL